MAFVRKKKRAPFKWPVDVDYPKDGGGFERSEFTAIFNVVPQSEFDALAEDPDEFKFLKRLLAGWEKMTEEDGTEIEFNDENLRSFVEEDRYWKLGVIRAYGKTFDGKGARKN
jgi:hypothetical protein